MRRRKMAKVSIATLDTAPVVDLPQGYQGSAHTQALFDRDKDPIHAHVHEFEQDAVLRIGPKSSDCLAYVWKGAVEAGGRRLAAGASLIVEHGATIEIRGIDDISQIVTFNGAHPPRALR